MAPRPTWKGYLRLSLVSCPVRVYSAIARNEKVSFNLLHKDTHNRIQMKPHDPELGAVERSDLVKGYEYEKGEYVIFTDEDLGKIQIESSKAIVIEKFVDSRDVDPIYFEVPLRRSGWCRSGGDLSGHPMGHARETEGGALPRRVLKPRAPDRAAVP
jgi:DNA end-binding protein Ku